jgi:hypothetical protein
MSGMPKKGNLMIAPPPSHRERRRLLLAALLGALVVGALPLAAGAGTSPVAPWKGSGPGTVTIGNDGTAAPAQMTYSLRSGAVFSTQTWSLFTTGGDGARTLKYDYQGYHAYYQVRVLLNAFVTHRGVTITTPLVSTGPVNCCTSPSGGFHYGGSVTLDVEPGDTYGFQFGGSNFDRDNILRGTVTVDTVTTSEDQCEDGGWRAVTDKNGAPFKTERDCVGYVKGGSPDDD